MSEDERRGEREMGWWTGSAAGLKDRKKLIVGRENGKDRTPIHSLNCLWPERHSLFDLVPIRVFNVCTVHHNLLGLS